MEIINCSLSYALQPPLQKEQLLVTALLWQEILEPIIAENKLKAVFNLAVRKHQTAFPINLHDLIKTYQENVSEFFVPAQIFADRNAEMEARGFPKMRSVKD